MTEQMYELQYGETTITILSFAPRGDALRSAWHPTCASR